MCNTISEIDQFIITMGHSLCGGAQTTRLIRDTSPYEVQSTRMDVEMAAT